MKKFEEQNITVHTGLKVTEITKEGVKCSDGTEIAGNVVVWSTGAEPQPVIAKSELEISKGYFRVNEFLQSTSHSNVFAGGDCITIAEYEDLEYNFPPKAGVYAVREGPIIAKNIANFINGEALEQYKPQPEFLALLMTGDEKAIGTKFGISFVGKWVWKLKDYIDVSFMNLFNPRYLFKDYETRGCEEPDENNELFEEDTKSDNEERQKVKQEVALMSVEDAIKLMTADEDYEGYLEQFMILERMKTDVEFREKVVGAIKESQGGD